MGLESPSFVNDFVTTNPDGSDARSQGDDHIRNMKSALRATLPNADRAFYFPTATTKTADFVVASTDMNKTFFVDVTSPSTSLIVTLPTLTASSDGWFCTFIKTTQDAKPLMIFPASGTLQSGFVTGMSSARRAAAGIPFRAMWSGGLWVIERCFKDPIGAYIDVPYAFLQPGLEWASGQTLASSTLYPEFFAYAGTLTLQDRRGRVGFGRDDMGGSAANRLTTASGGITGTSLGSAGGNQTAQLITSNLPPHSHVITVASTTPNPSVNIRNITSSTGTVTMMTDAANAIAAAQPLANFMSGASSMSHLHSATAGDTGSANAFAVVNPGIVTNIMVVTE